MDSLRELEITKTQRGYRYRIIDAHGSAKANVAMYTSKVRSSALADIRANLSDTSVFAGNDESLGAVGRLLYNLVVRPVPEIETFLREHDGPLFISTDDPEIPLEILHDEQEFLGLRIPLGRGILWSEPAPPPVTVEPKDHISILVIANPTGNLPGASSEADAITAALPSNVDFKTLIEGNASFVNVLTEISSGNYDIIHYAGHIGTIDNQGEHQAYLELGGASGGTRRVLAREITANLRGSPFVYLNGCSSSSRPKGAVGGYTENLARAWIKGGAISLIGTLWDVPDMTAGLVSQYFYKGILAGLSTGESLRRARIASRQASPDDPTWAAPILYGDPTLRLRSLTAAEQEQSMIGLDKSAVVILNLAIQEARSLRNYLVSSHHLFLAFLESPSQLMAQAIAKLSFSAEGLVILLRQSIRTGQDLHDLPTSERVKMSESVLSVLNDARQLARQEAMQPVNERHMLLAFLQSRRGVVFNLLNQLNLEPDAILLTLEGKSDRYEDRYPRQDEGSPAVKAAGRLNAFNLAHFDKDATRVLERAAQEANFASSGINTAHLLVALLEKENGYLVAFLGHQGILPARLVDALRKAQGYKIPVSPSAGYTAEVNAVSSRLRSILDMAVKIAQQEGRPQAGEYHILVSLLENGGGSSTELLTGYGVKWLQIQEALQQGRDSPPYSQKTPLLGKFGRDLTELARQGKLNQVVGRKSELEQIVMILSKDTKNNPILVGDAGVGKTAIVESLAQHIASGKIPAHLKNKGLIEVSMSDLVAGTRHRGDFEERIKDLINEIKDDPDILVFIDEIHTLVGAGQSSNGLDAANIFKPALARGEMCVIGATTPGEYQRTIAKDKALLRRFEKVIIEEPTAQDTLEILRATRSRYETRYQVNISDEALGAAVNMSIKYFPELRLPDKACNLLDEVCARLTTGTMSQWGAQDADSMSTIHPEVTSESIARVIAERKHLPIDVITIGEQERLLKLETSLGKRVVGQDFAVKTLARAVRMTRTGLKDAHRPSGVFLFIGPTGVGKTELGKALAHELFGSDDQIIRLDMSEFMEAHSVSKLIGAPPGYIGYEEEGQLTRALRRMPYSVVLIDEIEKASPAIFDLFLQLFDEGRLTDSHGEVVDGRHAFYIMTSNIGSELVGHRDIGFLSSLTEKEVPRQKLLIRLRQIFRPEFLNRIDEIILFQPLKPEHIRLIAQAQIANLQTRLLQERNVHLEVDEEILDFICSQGYDEKYGARPLKRTIMNLLTAPVSEFILASSARRISARLNVDQIEIVSDENE